MLEKTYSPADIEARIHQRWEETDAFKCGRPERQDAQTYCIVIPPPNVTGSLHMGHALNNTLQDILCRFERMRGKDVLWQPGTDHAGIATQLVVERQLAEKQINRREMGRENFLEAVWKWKAESGGTIVNQLKRLGASCDWSRERFTMDEGLSRAVLKVFVDLHKAGLIYKDKRLVNWDPEFQSAVSDLEVDSLDHTGAYKWSRGQVEKDGSPVEFSAAALAKVLDRDPSGHMYYLRYPIAGATYDAANPATYLVVGTTRPETMLGDTGVAIHPENEKIGHLIGKMVVLPLVGREIPVVGDTYADPEKGTGAVKITPAHDFNDFEVGRRQKLEMLNILDAQAKLNENAPKAYQGLDRFEARKRVVVDLVALGLVEKIEPHTHAVPHAQRGGAVIEPWLTEQWYVNAAELAKPALAAVKSGETKFVPERFANDYYRWLENIQPWCISRQLWWGHQIPAWYGPDGQIFVALDEHAAASDARKHYGKDEPLVRDPDVLDTWFSSGLWAFSTLGWPDQTREVARFYPTSALVTGFDIIFFWVARMMMLGCHFMKEVPFHDVYIHGLVRDEQGRKMSKTIGNTMDPLDIIDGIGLDALVQKRAGTIFKKSEAEKISKATRQDYPKGIPAYGADALRFALAAMASQGSDVKFSIQRVEGYRNFATKLWNASRFAEMNECVRQRDFDPKVVQQTVNKWIAGETEKAARATTEAIEAYKFNEAATAVYEFTWGIVCDWYVELVKPILNGDDEVAKAETRATMAWVLDQVLKLLHPFMPFITEELWAHMVEHGEARRTMLALSNWPTLSGLIDQEANDEIGWVVKAIEEVRSVRSEMNVPPGAKIPLVIVGASAEIRRRAERQDDLFRRLARLDSITFESAAPKGSAQMVVDDASLALPLAGVIDMAAEKKRLEREIEKADSEIGKIDAKLSNEGFVAKAPPEVVVENRERRAAFEETIRRLRVALDRLGEAA